MDIKIEKKKGIRFKHLLIGTAVLMIAYVSYHFIVTDYKRTYTVNKQRLIIGEVIQSEFKDFITITGHVAPIRTIYMDAYEGGRVKEKLVEEGAFIKKGDVILKLENRNLYEQILASENNLALKQNDLRSTKLAYDSRQINGKKELIEAKYELQKKKRNFEQQKSLFDEGLIAKEFFLVANENYDVAKKRHNLITEQVEQDNELKNTSLKDLDNDLERMKKTLGMVYERLDYLNVRAPFNGQLGFLDAEIGQNLQQGQRIGQINDLSNFKIEAEIDEHYIERVRRNLKASFERNELKYELSLRKVYPEVRNGKFKIDLVFEGSKPETIRAGQNYSLKLELGASNEALLIPRGSFFQSTGGRSVFVVNEQGTEAYKKDIKLGKQNSMYYEIMEGLMEGQKAIISSYDAFGDVDRVVFK